MSGTAVSGPDPGTPKQPARQLPYWVVALAVAALGVIAGALLVIALGQDPVASEPSVSPSASEPASAEPTPLSPTATPEPTLEPAQTPLPGPVDIVPPGSRIQVLTEGLRLRERAGLDAPVKLRIGAGEVLFAINTGGSQLPPTFADGYAWYPVQFIPGYADWPVDPPQTTAEFGYVAGHTTEGEWNVELMEPRCPATPDVESLAAMTEWERASCMGDQELTLEGTFGCGVCDALAMPGIWEPSWLAHYLSPLSPLSPVGQVQQVGVQPIVLAFPPDGERPDPDLAGSIMRMTGHFNDPASTDCIVGDDTGLSPESSAEWYCRERFVVESWEVTGTDPDYPAQP